MEEVIFHEDSSPSSVRSPPIHSAPSSTSSITTTLAATTKLTPIPKLREPIKTPSRNSSSIGSSSKQRAPIGNYENYGKVEIIWLQYYPNSSMELAKGCKLHELKDELRQRELSLQGNKPEIIDRLCDHFKSLRQNNEQTILEQQKKMYIALKLEYPPRKNTTPNTPKSNFLSPLLIPNNLMSMMAASQVTNQDISSTSLNTNNTNNNNNSTEKATQLIQQYAGMVPLSYLPVNTNNGVLSIPVGRVGPYYVYSPSSATSSNASPYSAAYINAYQQYQQQQYAQQIQNQLKQLQLQQQQQSQPMVISPVSSISPPPKTTTTKSNDISDKDDVFLNADDVNDILLEQGQVQHHEKQTVSTTNKRKYDELTVPDKNEDLLLRNELSPMKRSKPIVEEKNIDDDFLFDFLHDS